MDSTSIAFCVIGVVYLVVTVIMSFCTCCLYRKDKNAALEGEWRTTEKKLHICAACFGWPGALCAMYTLRHKNRKASFRCVLFTTVFFHVILLIAFVVLAVWFSNK